MLADLACLEEIVEHCEEGLGGTSRVRAFELLKEIDRFLTSDSILGNLRLELSISVRSIPPPASGGGLSSQRHASELWQEQALEAIRSVRRGLPA